MRASIVYLRVCKYVPLVPPLLQPTAHHKLLLIGGLLGSTFAQLKLVSAEPPQELYFRFVLILFSLPTVCFLNVFKITLPITPK